jgi:hypothetical protein
MWCLVTCLPLTLTRHEKCQVMKFNWSLYPSICSSESMFPISITYFHGLKVKWEEQINLNYYNHMNGRFCWEADWCSLIKKSQIIVRNWITIFIRGLFSELHLILIWLWLKWQMWAFQVKNYLNYGFMGCDGRWLPASWRNTQYPSSM